ncbi:EamA family transporter [Petroclostridium sp. X23]|uniref:DMT family transporter n=1 Tax=Petroclostridium sp. X23 TaxID=3045146 RepID=UPI0024ADDE74|nr:EamA family transporter [Petroclostridium sp. X23]WHH60701.1 EamA family transporter [Petroclostridium sp. X23]
MKKGYLYIILTGIAFSTIEIAVKMTQGINPFQLNFLRFLIGSLILLPFAIYDIKKRKLHFNVNDFLFFMLTGFIGVFMSMGLFQMAVANAKASTVAVIFSTNPIFTIPFAYVILKENMNKKMVLSFLISLIGIGFFLDPSSLNGHLKGIILSVLASIAFSLYSVVSKKRMERYGGLVLNCFTFLIGDAIVLAYLLFAKIPITKNITTPNILCILYLGVVATGLAYVLYFMAMKETSAITTSIVFFIKPALAPVLAFMILGETVTLNTAFGIIFILIGSYMMFRARKTTLVSKTTVMDVSTNES